MIFKGMADSFIVGGNSNNGSNAGPFNLNSNWYPSNSNVNVGASFSLTSVMSSQVGKI